MAAAASILAAGESIANLRRVAYEGALEMHQAALKLEQERERRGSR